MSTDPPALRHKTDMAPANITAPGFSSGERVSDIMIDPRSLLTVVTLVFYRGIAHGYHYCLDGTD